MDAIGFVGVRVSTSILIHQGIILLSLVAHTVLQSCSGMQDLHENSVFHSPSYPNKYLSYTECSWNITVPEGSVAVLQFLALGVQWCSDCGCDYVSIYDGSSTNSPLLQRICGTTIPPPIYASQNTMFVRFSADGSASFSGFLAKVSRGQLLVEYIESDNGTIQSPNYPDNYPPSQRCLWNITVPENQQIFVEFLDFELPYIRDCRTDFVEVRDGLNSSGPLLGKFCGTNVKRYLRSSGNKIIISFESDTSVEAKGFSLQFRKVPQCGSTIEDISGSIHSPNYPDNYGPAEKCRWTITVPEDHQVLFRILTMDIATSDSCTKDFILIYNGINTTAPLLGRFCGSKVPNVIKSTSSVITVMFNSDGSTQAKGFSARFETGFCGQEFNSESGTFHSPNYPNPYGAHEMCSWKVTVPEGYRVALRFDSFNFESTYRCTRDSVTVFDGLNSTSRKITTMCTEQTSKKKVYSKGNTLSVRMVTDASYSKSGFTASFIKAPKPSSTGTTEPPVPCEQEIKADRGSISSPRYPEWYSRNLECVWNIEVPKGNIIRLEFQSFDVEDDPRCYLDYLKIYDDASTASRSSSKFCGRTLPESRWSSSNKTTLKFVTDSSFERPGFSATFTKVNYSEENIVGNSGTLKSPNYPDNYGPAQKRVWNITVPSGYKIHLKFQNFELQYSYNCTDDFVEIRDGKSTRSSFLGKFCGASAPSDIRSSSNKLTVIFASDTSEETKGFLARFEKEQECGRESCRNGGTCKQGPKTLETCSCKHGYQGNLCGEKTLCTNNTCENGGTCFQNGTGGVFQCICNHGYEGTVCHERILCGNEICKNGGYCIHERTNSIFTCVCEQGYEGLLCERLVQKSSDTAVSIVVPLVVLTVIVTAAILFFLSRRRLKRQVTQPCDDMKQEETFFDKDETLNS